MITCLLTHSIAKYYFGEVNSDATATSTYDDYMPALKSKYEDDDIPSAAFFQGIKIRSPSVTSVFILTYFDLLPYSLTHFRLAVTVAPVVIVSTVMAGHRHY